MTAVYRTSPIKRNRRTNAEIAELDRVIYEVCKQDHPMTIRGVFYRVMSRGAVEKTEKAYDAIQRRVLIMRRARSLPYSWITDGTRWQSKPDTWTGLEEMLEDAALSYRRALWHDQNVHIEVWAEKDAISSIVYPVTAEFDVPLMVARGFSSESFLWATAQDIIGDHKPAVIYQLGDHDASGIKAWNDIQRKLIGFAPGVDFTFERIAVTPAQIEEYDLPTRPSKESSHSKGFEGESVEVDAMPTSVLKGLVRYSIEQWIDQEDLRITRIAEESEREVLTRMMGQVAG